MTPNGVGDEVCHLQRRFPRALRHEVAVDRYLFVVCGDPEVPEIALHQLVRALIGLEDDVDRREGCPLRNVDDPELKGTEDDLHERDIVRKQRRYCTRRAKTHERLLAE